jgi:site-specific DNA recombinase
MKCVAYIRVSTEEQVYGTSLEGQEKACIDYARQNNLDLPAANIFREEGESAKLLDRTQLQKMLEFCKKNKGKIEYCIVWKVDRLARKSEYHHAIKAMLLKHGVKLKSVTEPIGDDPIGSLMEGVLAAFAQFDNDIRTHRTTSGMRMRTEQGGWPHDAPYGYKKAKTATGISSVEPDEHASIAKRFLETFATGAYTVRQAEQLAKKLGIRSRGGRAYGWQVTKNMLQNPLYAGYVSTKFTDGRYIQGLHKPIISVETHYKNKAIIAGSLHKNSRHAEDSWPLRGGFIKCSHCNHPLTGSSPRGRSRHYPRYSCPKCRISPVMPSTSADRDKLHDEFMELMQSIKPSPKVAALFKEIVLTRWNHEYKDALEHSRRVNDELTALQDKKSRVLDLFIEGKLTDQQKAAKLIEVEDKIADFELKKAESTVKVANKEQVVDAGVMLLSAPHDFWNLGTLEVRKRLQDLIFPEGVPYSFGQGFGTAKVNESYLLIQRIAQKGDSDISLVAATGIEPVTSGL